MKGSLALYQALISINVDESKASAVVDALESDMQTQLATKADVNGLKADISLFKAEFAQSLAQSELRLTIRLGVMLSAAVGVMLAALRFMH